MKNFDHENSHRHEFTSKVRPSKITLFQKTSENVFQWLFLWKCCVFWQYLGEQASDRQLPVSCICKQRQNSESVEKIVRFLAILQEWIKISYKNAKLWDQLSPNSVNWSQVKRILTNPVPKLGNRVTKTPRGRCHLGWTQFEKSAFIAVFYWLVKDRPVSNPLAPYLIRKGTNSASFWGRYFRHLRAFCGLKLNFFASFRLKCVLATRDVCKRPRRLHHWNRHSISDPVIPHIAV